MFKRFAFSLDADLPTSGTVVLNGWVDRLTLANDGHRMLVGDDLYESPTDFTLAVDPRGRTTLTWLAAPTVPEDTEVVVGVAMIDSITSGDVTSSGGGGGGAITSVDLGTKAETAATTDTGTFSLIALFKRFLSVKLPASLGAKTAAASFPITLSSDNVTTLGTIANNIGPISEEAAASDTAASGLNGLVKRALARFTLMVNALGTPADAAWTAGDMTLAAGIKALATKSNSTAPTITQDETCSYIYIAANSTDTAAGNANDLLDSIIFVPTSLNPGAVSIEDGAGTNRVLFEGGTGSIVTKHPWTLDMKNITAVTGWEVTAGADMNLWVLYRARV